ncbi:LuxR C-terminal-related transcriptional regulator [Devosia sp.]|jgi:two-component system nitrate/nitrite response regulator NarL|uniref:LuxR C-terminal-related transcriptional regulator n=1 Tax=Devosia sp. TaxID=1871048 RepID=UPI0037C0EEB0
MNKTRIAFIDDHPTLLAGMVAIFSTEPDYEIVGTGVSADDAVRLAETAAPDVLIADMSMPGDVFAAIANVTRRTPPVQVIVFTAYANVDTALQAVDAGAQGFVLKGRPTTDLLTAIQTVRSDEIYVSPDFAPKLMGGFRNRARREKEMRSAQLSAREVQIVECLLQAKSNKEIARTLDLSEKTIKHYMTNLMNKLKVKSRLEVVLAAQALQAGTDTDKDVAQP